MTALNEILTSAEQRITTLTGYNVKLRISRGKAIPKDLDQSVDMIFMAVEMAYGVDTSALKGKSRKRPLPDARRLACLLMKENNPLIKLKDIGSRIGFSDHKSVIHYLKTGENLLQTDPYFLSKYEEVKRTLGELCNTCVAM